MKARIALILASTLAVGSVAADTLTVSQAVQYQHIDGSRVDSFTPQVDVTITYNDNWVLGVSRFKEGYYHENYLPMPGLSPSSVLLTTKGEDIVSGATFGYRFDYDLYKGEVLTLQAALTLGVEYVKHESSVVFHVDYVDVTTEASSSDAEFDFHYDPHLTARLALTDALSVDANIHAYYDLDLKQVVSKQSLGLTYKF